MSTVSGAVGTSKSHGTKVTNDPAADTHPVEEGTGTITSDSLAAESLRSGGDFAANQDQEPGISGQPSKGFTGATTDTSGARKIEGKDSEDPSTTKAKLDAGIQHGKSAGVGPTYNADSVSKGTSSSAGVAPTAHWDNVDERVLQPKGENLKEGGDITGSEKNTSFTTDIGGKNDPALLAEQKFASANADQPAAGGTSSRDSKISQGVYDALNSEERA